MEQDMNEVYYDGGEDDGGGGDEEDDRHEVLVIDKVESNNDEQQQQQQSRSSCSSTSSPDEDDHVSGEGSSNDASGQGHEEEEEQQQQRQQHEDDEEEEVLELVEEDEGATLGVQARLLRELFTFDAPEPSTRMLSDLLGQIIVGQTITADDRARYEAAAPGAAEFLQLIDQYVNTGGGGGGDGEGCSGQPEASADKNVDNINIAKSIATSSSASSSTTNTKPRRKRNRPATRVARPPGRWHEVPSVVLEKIYSKLSIKERHQASQVCPHWYRCFYSSVPWSTFYLTDTTFTKYKHNYYLGLQRILDPYKTHMFLFKFARAVRRLVIEPMGNFFNLYEFMNILANYSKFYDYPYENLRTLDFNFGCHLELAENAATGEGGMMSAGAGGRAQGGGGGGRHNWSRDSVFGTGGKILESLKKLMCELKHLRHLALRNLLLDRAEASHLLDDVVDNLCEQLETLTLINCCNVSYAFVHVGVFVRLRRLVLSPQHLSEDVLLLLADVRTLADIHLVQTEETKNVQTLQPYTWKRFHTINPKIKVHLGLARRKPINTEIPYTTPFVELIKPKARISSLSYDTSHFSMQSADLWEVCRLYSDHLECVAFFGLPKYYHTGPYPQRVDAALINLVENCDKLSTLVVRDTISTSTLLVLVTYGRNLRRLYVRQSGLRKRFDCADELRKQWNESFVQWLATTARDYEATFAAVSEKLGYQWRPLSDWQFKQLRPEVRF